MEEKDHKEYEYLLKEHPINVISDMNIQFIKWNQSSSESANKSIILKKYIIQYKINIYQHISFKLGKIITWVSNFPQDKTQLLQSNKRKERHGKRSIEPATCFPRKSVHTWKKKLASYSEKEPYKQKLDT